jgi:hypothetical protein
VYGLSLATVAMYRLKPELLAAVQAAMQSTVLQGASYEVTAEKLMPAAHNLKDRWLALQVLLLLLLME